MLTPYAATCVYTCDPLDAYKNPTVRVAHVQEVFRLGVLYLLQIHEITKLYYFGKMPAVNDAFIHAGNR